MRNARKARAPAPYPNPQDTTTATNIPPRLRVLVS